MEEKTYASFQLPFEEEILEYAVTSDGGDYSKVQVVPGAAYDAVSALQSNIDTIWIYAGWDKIACEKAGLDYNFIMFTDVAKELDYYTPVLIAGNDYLAENPETAKAFLAATAKGYTYCCKNPEAAADILCKAVPELDAEMVLASQQYLAGEYISDSPYWGYIDPERWNAFYGWLYEKGLTEKSLEDVGFTNDYLTE